MEFIRGPNVYFREPIISDITMIGNALSDWELLEMSDSRIKTFFRSYMVKRNNIDRPYNNDPEKLYREMFTVCKTSDDTPVGIVTWTVDQLNARGLVTAIDPTYRSLGYMNEIILLRSIALFNHTDVISWTAETNWVYPTFVTILRQQWSDRIQNNENVIFASKAHWDSWCTSNTIPEYTYSGAGFIKPINR